MQQTADRGQHRRLAGPVGPDDAGDAALGHVDGDVLEDVASAVAGVDAAQGQQRLGAAERLALAQHVSGGVALGDRRTHELLLGRRVVLTAQVGVEHGGVRAHFVRRAGHERGALGEHGDPVTEPHHELHVVLDHEERLARLVELDDPVGQVPDQRRVHAARGLVEQQHARVGDEQRGELEQLALAVGERAGRVGGQGGDADEVQQLHGPALLGRRAGAAGQAAQPALLALGGHEHVLEHGQAREEPRELEGAPDAEAEHAVRRGVGDVGAAEAHLTLLDALIAGDDVEQGRLARAVGPDQPVDLALADLEVAGRQRLDPAEGLRDPGDVEQRAHRATPATSGRGALSRGSAARTARAARRRCHNPVRLGTTPRGSSRITSRNRTP